jgi:hypothetical protein
MNSSPSIEYEMVQPNLKIRDKLIDSKSHNPLYSQIKSMLNSLVRSEQSPKSH